VIIHENLARRQRRLLLLARLRSGLAFGLATLAALFLLALPTLALASLALRLLVGVFGLGAGGAGRGGAAAVASAAHMSDFCSGRTTEAGSARVNKSCQPTTRDKELTARFI
jgi:hypothetical protein